MELCLGTVQFGLDYGIKGLKKPAAADALRCLDYAVQNGVTALDTAAAYGTAEEVVGSFLKQKTIARDRLFISTKLLPNILDDVRQQDYRRVIRENLQKSLAVLHTDYVDAYLLHSARYAFCPQILDALADVRREGLAKTVGVSVYEPEEACACMEHENMGLIQVPYSLLDHRMKESGVFKKAGANFCRVAVRSAFLQGLVTLEKNQIPDFLKKAGPVLQKIDRISRETGKSRIELAMGYVKKEASVSYLVFGVDSAEQLAEDIGAFQEELPQELYQEIETECRGIGEDIVIPSLWKK